MPDKNRPYQLHEGFDFKKNNINIEKTNLMLKKDFSAIARNWRSYISQGEGTFIDHKDDYTEFSFANNGFVTITHYHDGQEEVNAQPVRWKIKTVGSRNSPEHLLKLSPGLTYKVLHLSDFHLRLETEGLKTFFEPIGDIK